MSTPESDAAVTYTNLGLYVFPCAPDKRPLVKWKTAATNDPSTAQQMWEHWPSAMIGMACGPSKIVAIDIDVTKGKDGWGTIDALMLELGELPGTRTSQTPSGGSHMLFRVPPGIDLSNSVEKLGSGVDIRAGWGYIILPPSSNGEGAYVWTCDVKTALLPDKWIERLRKPAPKPPPARTPRPVLRDSGRVRRYGAKVLTSEADNVAGAQPGRRNNTVTVSAFRVGQVADECGIAPGQAEEMFAWAVNQWGDAAEARKAADSFWRAFEAGRQSPRHLELRHG